MAREPLLVPFSRVPTKVTHPPDDGMSEPATIDAPGRHENTARSAGMALPCPDERAAEVRAKMDEEIKQLEQRMRELAEEIELHQGHTQQQQSWGTASLGSRKTGRRLQAYRSGATGEGTGGRQGAMEEKIGFVEEGQRFVVQGRKWQRGIEVAEMLVGLDNKIKECLAIIDQERDQLEQLRREVAQLHAEQREMTIETGGIASALLSEESRSVDGALLELSSVRATRERQRRHAGGWSDCESD